MIYFEENLKNYINEFNNFETKFFIDLNVFNYNEENTQRNSEINYNNYNNNQINLLLDCLKEKIN